MARSFDGVAERFRAAIEREHVVGTVAAEDRERRVAEDNAARDALIADLRALAASLGVVAVTEVEGGIAWRLGEREVRFAASEPGRLAVTWREVRSFQGQLYRERALGDRWVLIVGRPPLEDRVPLLDAGVERLLVAGLGLPAPDDAGATDDGEVEQEAQVDHEEATEVMDAHPTRSNRRL
jgi:hypothetical protein